MPGAEAAIRAVRSFLLKTPYCRLGVQQVTYMLRSSPAFTALEEPEAIDYFLLQCPEACLNVRLSSLSVAPSNSEA